MIVPCGHRVLVKIDEVEENTNGGIFIPKASAEKQEEAGIFGTLVAVGDTAWKDFGGRAWACVGDRVMIAKYGGFIAQESGDTTKYRILNDEDLVAVIKSGNYI
jgi:co-chaperonin GroES (HSP10)